MMSLSVFTCITYLCMVPIALSYCHNVSHSDHAPHGSAGLVGKKSPEIEEMYGKGGLYLDEFGEVPSSYLVLKACLLIF